VTNIKNNADTNSALKVDSIRKRKPPPVILSNAEDYSEVKRTLEAQKVRFTANLMNNNQIKINVDNEHEHRDLTKTMNAANWQWHTYENKQTRPIRIMVRNLHPSCKPEEIKTELTNRGFQILDVVNKIQKRKDNNNKYTVTALPLFMLTFANTEEVKKIYDIQHICNLKVKIEALKSNKLIPQCKRCQRYGHTQRFCQRDPNCVKCAGQHLTAECSKQRKIAPKCYNCGEAHPASYRGCMVAKELQKRRDNLNKTNKSKTDPRREFVARKTTSELTFAQAAQGSVTREPIQKENDKQIMELLQNIQIMIDKLAERIDKLEARNERAIAQKSRNQ